MELAASAEAIEAARARLRGIVVRTPLVPLEIPGRARPSHLKLETLQPAGSFKSRRAGSATWRRNWRRRGDYRLRRR